MAGCLTWDRTVSVSLSWLYQRIRQDRAQGGSLYTCLWQGNPGTTGRDFISGRRDIGERPAIADSK